MRSFYRNLSIKNKLQAIFTLASMIILILVSVFNIIDDMLEIKANLIRVSKLQSSLTAEQCIPAMDFNDSDGAGRILSYFKANPDIHQAWLMTNDNQEFASYTAEKGDTSTIQLLGDEEYRFNGSYLWVRTPVSYEEKVLGDLIVKVSTVQMRKEIYNNIFVSSVFFIALLVFAWFIAGKLQQAISNPILMLSEATGFVRKNLDFSKRITRINNDELGTLTDNFNLMLEKLQQSDQKRSRAEEVLKESEGHYRALFEDSPVPIWEQDFSEVKSYIQSLKKKEVTDFKEFFDNSPDVVIHCIKMVRICDMNNSVLRLLEISTGRDAINQLGEIFIPESVEMFKEVLYAIALNKMECEYDTIIRSLNGKDKHIHLKWVVVPGYEKTLEKVYISTVDISSRKEAEAKLLMNEKQLMEQMEEYQALTEEYYVQNEELTESLGRVNRINEELNKARAKAEESDKLKSAFLANMSHEIRTPMNGILGFTDLLRQPKLTGEKRQRYIDVIQQSGKRMLNIINDLIDISKIEAGQIEIHKEDTDVNELLINLFDFFKPDAIAKGLTLKLNSSKDHQKIVLYTDKTKLNQIVSNLINNAIKYTESGKVEFGYNILSGRIEFYVTDTGIGIAPELHSKIFERFRQADLSPISAIEGAGLGLSISKAYIELLKGTVGLDSKPGEGSRFYFTLPLDQINTDSQFDNQDLKLSNIDLIGKTVLVAEDDEISFLYLEELLLEMNIEVLRAKNGHEAIDIVKQHAEINLVLMDIKMSEMDGLEATKLIKDIYPELPVIAQTAYTIGIDKETAFHSGCDDYLSKPIKREELVSCFYKYMEVF